MIMGTQLELNVTPEGGGEPVHAVLIDVKTKILVHDSEGFTVKSLFLVGSETGFKWVDQDRCTLWVQE